MRVIIIGSGIAGLSAAIALRKVGIDVAVYERAPQLGEVGAGISLWANALRALDYIGAGDAIRRVSLKMTRSEIRARNGFKIQFAFNADELERKAGVPDLVRIIDLVTALAALLPPGTARYGQACDGVDLREKSGMVRFKTGHTDNADVVIGADGIRSAVRAAILGPDEPRYSGYTCWRGNSCRLPGGRIEFINRGTAGSGHGWAIGWAVAWNCTAQEFDVQQPPGAMNWCIGCIGDQKKGSAKNGPWLSSPGTPVSPASLYLAQLRERLGENSLTSIGY